MSAILCSTRHVLALALHLHRLDSTQAVRPTALALRSLNNAALAACSGAKPARLYCSHTAIVAAQTWLETATAADLHQLCVCMAYQCDEAPKDHAAQALLTTMCGAFHEAAKGLPASTVWNI